MWPYLIMLIIYTIGTFTLVRGIQMAHEHWHNKTCKLYGLTTVCSYVWCLGFGFEWMQRSADEARLWRNVGLIGVMWFFIVLTELIICFLNASKAFIGYVRIVAGLGILLWPFITGEEDASYTKMSYGMTYQLTNNIPNTLYNILCITMGVNIFIMLSLIYKKAEKKRLKVVALRLCNCCIIVMIGMLFDTLFPLFGFYALPGSTFSQGIAVLLLSAVVEFQLESEISIENMSTYVYYSVNTPVLIYDENERFRLANAGANDFFGADYEDMTMRRLWEIFSLPMECMFFDGNKDVQEAECLYNHRYCAVEINKIIDQYQDINGYIVIFNDITERRDYIQKLQESEQKAEMANRAKTNFLARMSHEIRTPINGIIGMNEVILRDSKDEKTLECAHMVNTSAHSLVELVNDILDISKLEANRITLENVVYNLPSLLREVTALAQVRAQPKKLAFRVKISGNLPVELEGDEKKVRQILTNIIGNAIKYTREGSVTLKVESLIHNREYYLGVSVKDTGIGIKQENIDKIFDAFERVDSTENNRIEGTGLGLYIVKSLVNLMNGTIKVYSRYGEGSEFVVEIPQKPIKKEYFSSLDYEQDTTEDIAQISLAIPDKRILVVDDNEINRFVACELLSYTQATVDSADSGRVCLELVQKNKYDFILLDHIMPEMDGIQVLRELKKMPNNISKDAVVIILTANAIQGAKEDYLSKGFDDYLSKPIDMEQVEAVLGKYC